MITAIAEWAVAVVVALGLARAYVWSRRTEPNSLQRRHVEQQDAVRLVPSLTVNRNSLL